MRWSSNVAARELPLDTVTVDGRRGSGAAGQARTDGGGLEPDSNAALPRFLEIYDDRLLLHTQLYPGTRECSTRCRLERVWRS